MVSRLQSVDAKTGMIRSPKTVAKQNGSEVKLLKSDFQAKNDKLKKELKQQLSTRGKLESCQVSSCSEDINEWDIVGSESNELRNPYDKACRVLGITAEEINREGGECPLNVKERVQEYESISSRHLEQAIIKTTHAKKKKSFFTELIAKFENPTKIDFDDEEFVFVHACDVNSTKLINQSNVHPRFSDTSGNESKWPGAGNVSNSQCNVQGQSLCRTKSNSFPSVYKVRKSVLYRSYSESAKHLFYKDYSIERDDRVLNQSKKRRLSMFTFTKDDNTNAKVVVKRYKAMMEKIHNRKIKQRIARRMVEFSALNKSRLYTDAGEPYSLRSRSLSHQPQTTNWRPLLLRTISDPESNFSSENPDAVDSSEFAPANELYETYTAVGSHEDIHQYDETKRQSVKALLSSFESNLDLNESQKPQPKPRPPKPKPRKSLPDCIDAIEGVVACSALEDLTSIQQSHSLPPKSVLVSPTEHPELPATVKSVPQPFPKPKPKPLDLLGLVSNENSSHQAKNGVVVPADGIEAKNHLKNPDISGLPSYVPIKQTQTKGGSQPEIFPYAIVKLEKENTDIAPSLPEKKSPSLVSPLDTHESEYLQPVESKCVQGLTGCTTRDSSKKKSQQKRQQEPQQTFEVTVEKSSKQSKKKHFKYGKDKSSTLSKALSESEIQRSFQDNAFRRQSLPDYLAAGENNDSSIRESMYETVSPTVSDDEGWGADEFESSGEEDFGIIEDKLTIPKLPHLDGVQKKIYNIVTEILTTERAYVKRLYLLDKIFHERISLEAKENNGVIPEKVVIEIFPNLTPIYTFHSTILLPELEKRIQEWAEVDRIGDIFKTLGHCLLLYTEFVKNFDHATTTLAHWMKKSPKFSALVEELQKRPECENLSLQHHMLEPVQRVPRYKLLLSDYLKKLPLDSPDRAESKASLEIISKAAENANNSMKENEKFKKLLDIEDRILDGLKGESLVTASRVFVKEGEVTKIAARSGSKMARTILLFNDCLLCCVVSTTGKLRVRQIMDLAGLTIVEADEMLPANAFRIKSKQRILDLSAKNSEEKEGWVASIRGAVTDFNEKRGNTIERMLAADNDNRDAKVGETAPLWVKDEDVTMCMLCACKFGVVHRKHHCRGCGRVVCDKCSNYRASLPYAGNMIKRVCFGCSKKLGHVPEDVQSSNLKLQKSIYTRDSTAYSDISGEMWWKPPGKGWSKEWLVLADFVLYIQKKRQDVKAHTQIPVPGLEVDEPSSADEIDMTHPHSIKLHKQNKKDLTYLISSDSKDLTSRWKEHLNLAVLLRKLSTID